MLNIQIQQNCSLLKETVDILKAWCHRMHVHRTKTSPLLPILSPSCCLSVTINWFFAWCSTSINFHSCINVPDEQVCGIKSNCSCQQPEGQHHDKCVAKIQKTWDKILDVKLQQREEENSTVSFAI